MTDPDEQPRQALAGLNDRRDRKRFRLVSNWRILYTLVIAASVLGLLGRDMAFMRTTFVYDVFIYQCYARGFWQGPAEALRVAPETHDCYHFWGQHAERFRVLPREYPAPALLVFSLPLLTPWLPYNTAFLWWMALVLLITSVLLAWRGPPTGAVAFPLYILLAGWQFALDRYDLIPGLCILLALILANRHKPRLMTMALAAGTLLKGFPLLLFPLALLTWRREEGHWRWDCVAIFIGLMGSGLLPFFLINAQGFWSPLAYAEARPLHVEALSGMLLWITGQLQGNAHIVFGYGSYNVVAPAQGLFAEGFQALFVAGLAGAYVMQWRQRTSLVEGFIRVLIVTLVMNKVFSPQYILWILPTVAFYEGIRLRWLVVATLVFFISGDGALPFSTGPISSPPEGGSFPSPSFVARVLACHVILCWIALTHTRNRPTEHISSRSSIVDV